jgi:hypothetical protein
MIVDQKLNKGFVGAILIDGTIDGTKLGVSRQPTRFQRFCMRVLLGWKWANLKELKTKKEDKVKDGD